MKPSKGLKKHIRKQKALMKKGVVSVEEIDGIYKKHYDHKRDLQSSDKKGN